MDENVNQYILSTKPKPQLDGQGSVNSLAEAERYRRQLGILELFGTIDYDPDYNYKEGRRKR